MDKSSETIFSPQDMLIVIGEQTMQLRLARQELGDLKREVAELQASEEERDGEPT